MLTKGGHTLLCHFFHLAAGNLDVIAVAFATMLDYEDKNHTLGNTEGKLEGP